MTTIRAIEVASLLIDTDNPRLADTLQNQYDAIRSVASNQGRKLVALAKDIVENGLNPADILLVMPYEDSNRYIVLEGNRRVAALRILENPEIIQGAVEDSILGRLQKQSAQYLTHPISALNCVVVDSREQAYHWIELRHTGENRGAGVVRWGAAEVERFRTRSGQKPPHIQLLDFLEERKHISSATRRQVPVSSLRRLISTPHVRDKLGIKIEDGKVVTGLDEDEVSQGLKRVVEDLATRSVRTKDIYYAQDRINYIDSLGREDLPDTTRAKSDLHVLDEVVKTDQKKPSRVAKRSKPSRRKRSTLVPLRGLALRIDQPRINEIYHELRQLKVEDYTNAVAVLFRVFLELGVDDYVARNKVSTKIMSRLSKKITDVASDLAAKGKLNDQQVKTVRRVAQPDSFLGTTVTMMHQYIHNQYFHPLPGDLIATWDSLQPFFEAIWS